MDNRVSSIEQIIVFKETRQGETRVGLTPNAIEQLRERSFRILVESNAGKLAGFTDQDYENSGAKMIKLGLDTIPSQSLILRVKRPTQERQALENMQIPMCTSMIGFLDPFDDDLTHLENWKRQGITPIFLELMDLPPDDRRNAQSAMSQIAGRQAFIDAINRYQGSLEKRVTVIGPGPAGLEAALEAKKMGLPVQVFGRSEASKRKVEGLNLRYHQLPNGYNPSFLRPYLRNETIIVTAARNIGQKAPLLIDQETLDVLPRHAVIVDLSTGEGGSVIGSQSDKIIKTNRDISIVNVSGYPKAEPKKASEAFAQCMLNLLNELILPSGKIDWQHSILKHHYVF